MKVFHINKCTLSEVSRWRTQTYVWSCDIIEMFSRRFPLYCKSRKLIKSAVLQKVFITLIDRR